MTQRSAVLILGCLAGGVGALLFGFTLEWDMFNYHLYNPHALLSGRHAIDVAPAQQQNYLNPALFLLPYLLFMYSHTAVLVFVTGMVQGSQFLLLALILGELCGKRKVEGWMLLTVAVLGLAGPIFLGQLGSTQGDTILSVFVLAGLLLVLRELRRIDASSALRSGLSSGLLLGMACGLKLTIAVYALSLALACFICFNGAARWRILSGLALGGILGVLLTGGVWFWYMWQSYGSPLFPYMNNIFTSEWIDQRSYRDVRFLPRSLGEWLFYPYYWLTDPFRVWELSFRDLRVPLVIATVFVLPFFGWRRARSQAPALAMTWLFLAFSYLLWIWVFAIYRYLSVVEMLAPLVIFASACLWLKSRRGVLVALCLLIGTQAFVTYGRHPSTWALQADTPTSLARLPADAMVVIDGYEPVAYAALWLDDDIPLIRVRSNFMWAAQPQHRLQELAHQRIRRHRGPLYLLMPELESDAPFLAEDLGWLDLGLDSTTGCAPVFETAELQERLGLLICPLARRAAPAQSPDQ